MGNFEKLVVLTVLFLAAVVLGVSLNTDDAEANEGDSAQNPIEDALDRMQDDLGRGSGEATALLSAETGGGEDTVVDAPVTTEEPARILIASWGTRPSRIDDFVIYTCVDGDTWTALAERFYGDARYASLLRGANEGYERPEAKLDVLVPVHDLAREVTRRAPVVPIERTTATTDPVAEQQPVAEEVQPASGTWVIASGDSLSKISYEVYGTAHRWREIYDANRDVLASPDWLELGVTLRIP